MKLQRIAILFLFLSQTLYAWHWMDLWQTHDQQATLLLKNGRAQQAANTFKNRTWQAVASYRAGDYLRALNQFSQKKNSDAYYNTGNAAAFLGRYKDAIALYDKAIALNSNNRDAIFNRDLLKKLMQKKNQQSKSNNKKDSKNSKNSSQASANNNTNKQNNNQSDNKDNADTKQSQQNNPKQTPSQDKQNSSASQDEKNMKDKQAQSSASNANQWDAKQEKNNQMLRRVAEDPGGLLRQKFLRDYLRRHADNNNDGGN